MSLDNKDELSLILLEDSTFMAAVPLVESIKLYESFDNIIHHSLYHGTVKFILDAWSRFAR